MNARQVIYAALGRKHTRCIQSTKGKSIKHTRYTWHTKGINYQSHEQGSAHVPSVVRELGVYLNSLHKDSYKSVHNVESKTGVSMHLLKFKGTFIEAAILQPLAAGFSIFFLECKN